MSEIRLPTPFQEFNSRLRNENRFYVYKHVDPDTGDLLYLGKGSGQRAWMCLGGYDDTRYGHRSREHAERLNGFMDKGYLPCDWVVIVERGLTSSAAMKKEQELIRTLKPLFNRVLGKKICKVNLAGLVRMREMRLRGQSYKTIADQFHISTLTAYRALKGQTKNLIEA